MTQESLQGVRLHLVTPHFNPRGGVIKLLDYGEHAASLGLQVKVHSADSAEPGLPLFQVERFAGIADRLDFSASLRPEIQRDDLVLFTWPRDYIDLSRAAPLGFDGRRFIHLVQSTQHPTVSFARGYGRRLLRQPISRIAVSEPVRNSIDRFIPIGFPLATIDEGHDWQYFNKATATKEPWHEGQRPLRVGHVSWKSQMGHRLAQQLDHRDDLEFRSIDRVANWSELRALYGWSDVFLSLPAAEEGFYMVGFEAMAAGAVVITPDVGGNLAYCRFGENCLGADYEDLDSYSAAIDSVLAMTEGARREMTAAAARSVQRFDLSSERAKFATFIEDLIGLVG